MVMLLEGFRWQFILILLCSKAKEAPLPKMGDSEYICLYNLLLLSCISLYVVTCIYAQGPYGLLH